MATLNFPRKGTAYLSSGHGAQARMIDVIVDLSTDVTMGTATDDITVADLPGGSVVLAAGIEQVTVGTGSGTLVARVGSTTVSATLASTDPVLTVPATVPAAIPLVVPLAGATLNVLGATAVRTTGRIRVWAIVVEGVIKPTLPVAAARDTSL